MFTRWRISLAAAVVLALMTPVLARDNGQFSNVPPDVRAWFKTVRSKNGTLCCDIADGHRTDYDMRASHYYVPIDGKWIQVPDDAVVENYGNPTGDAVVWYTESIKDAVFIRCFVPGGGL